MPHIVTTIPRFPASFERLLCALCLSTAVLVALPAFAQKVSVEIDQSTDFGKFSTFAIKEGHLNSKSPALNSELTKKRIAAGIEKGLTAKGLISTTGPADLTVSFEFGSSRELEAKAVPAGPRGLGTRVVNLPQSEGLLVIDLYDASTHSLVWRGTASDSEANAVKLADKLDDMVRKSIAKYPAKKSKGREH